ncbi:MAG TPA: hypothetical protein VIM85_00015, partial [Pseudomonadales bacterium]
MPISSGTAKTEFKLNGAGQLLSEITYNSSGTQTGHASYIWLGAMPLAVINQSQSGNTITQTQLAY